MISSSDGLDVLVIDLVVVDVDPAAVTAPPPPPPMGLHFSFSLSNAVFSLKSRHLKSRSDEVAAPRPARPRRELLRVGLVIAPTPIPARPTTPAPVANETIDVEDGCDGAEGGGIVEALIIYPALFDC